LAEAVVAAASKVAEEQGLTRVSEVMIRVGELQQIEPEVFEFALSQLKSGRLEHAAFVTRSAKARLRCRACGRRWSFSREKLDADAAEAIHFVPEVAHSYIRCPRCGSPDFEFVEGRGVWLESVTGAR